MTGTTRRFNHADGPRDALVPEHSPQHQQGERIGPFERFFEGGAKGFLFKGTTDGGGMC
jgi:hypothetical protein